MSSPTTFEVKQVLSHRIVKGAWKFQIQFTDKSTEWVKDEECQCEYLISQYLEQYKPSTKTVYCFCRVSTKEQAGDASTSLEAQEKELYQYAKQLGANRVRIYKISSSAYTSIPVSLQNIGEGARKGDTILIYRVDRLSRNIIKYFNWLEDLDVRGVKINALEGELSYSDDKLDFLQAVLTAQRESALIGKRVKMSLDYRRERGDEYIGGKLAYGKQVKTISDKNGKVVRKVIENNPTEQKIIKRIITTYKKDQNIDNIVKKLSEAGVLKRGKPWTSKHILDVLTN